LNKINILVYCLDKAGVGYFRQTNPHKKLQDLYPDEFYVEFENNPDKLLDDEYLKKFHILQFHRTITNYDKMPAFLSKARKNGLKIIMDIDDYWNIHKEHPAHSLIMKSDPPKKIIENLKMVDYVTTTTKEFATEIRKYNKNVEILYNGIDPDEHQFENKINESKRVRVGLITGSSHYADIEQLKTTFNKIASDKDLLSKIQLTLCGFDLRGKKIFYDYVTDELIHDLSIKNLYNEKIHQLINMVKGNLNYIKSFPIELKIKYQNKLTNPVRKELPIPPTENTWFKYEKLLTDNHSIISDKQYLSYLMSFKNEQYSNYEDQPYVRWFTKPIKQYATHYNNIDICLTPLIERRFNELKSNLKVIEAGFFKKPIIVSEMNPYLEDIKHGENAFQVKHKRNHKDWYKFIKRLVDSKDLREEMGNNLYETVKDKYNLNTITEKRKELYKRIVE